MGTLLLLETATDICSVAISEGTNLRASKTSSENYTHTSAITPLIEQCVAAANMALTDLDAIAVSSGPGSYTALRVGSSTAKGLCYALDIPMIAIDTLQAIAHATADEVKKTDALYCPMIDARRMEVYAALFDYTNKPLTTTEPLIVTASAFQTYFEQGQSIVFSGDGAAKCQSLITSPLASFVNILCAADHLAPLAAEAFEQQQFVEAAYFKPTYGKAPNITIPKKRL